MSTYLDTIVNLQVFKTHHDPFEEIISSHIRPTGIPRPYFWGSRNETCSAPLHHRLRTGNINSWKIVFKMINFLEYGSTNG
jgi:hypothetical protein